MNERIREIAEQAGLEFDDDLALEPEPIYYITQKELEKLAKLIVAEMLQTCEDHPGWSGRMIGEQIKEHFGVEL